jgi:hypothetical protein
MEFKNVNPNGENVIISNIMDSMDFILFLKIVKIELKNTVQSYFLIDISFYIFHFVK